MKFILSLIDKAKGAVIPAWAEWLTITVGLAALAGFFYGLGRLDESRAHGKAEVVEVVRLVKGQEKVITKVDTVYRDRIVKIVEQGAKIEHQIPDYIPPVADQQFPVSLGFVRVIDGAWKGSIVGPARSTDAEPSSVPLSELAAIEAGNATSCRAWREQALGWRVFYAGQQEVINGKAGDWYKPETSDGPAVE